MKKDVVCKKSTENTKTPAQKTVKQAARVVGMRFSNAIKRLGER